MRSVRAVHEHRRGHGRIDPEAVKHGGEEGSGESSHGQVPPHGQKHHRTQHEVSVQQNGEDAGDAAHRRTVEYAHQKLLTKDGPPGPARNRTSGTTGGP